MSTDNLAKIPDGGDLTDYLPYTNEANEEDLRWVTDRIDINDRYVERITFHYMILRISKGTSSMF